jgi:uncharacterized protein involved in exopolysaccharide biosynthesis
VTTTPIRPRPPSPDPGGGTLFDWTLLRDWGGFAVRAVRRHAAVAFAAFAAVVGLGLAAAWALPRTYEVEAKVLALRNPVVSALSNPGVNRPAESDAPTRAAQEAILRRDNLVALVERTRLVERWDATRAPAGRLRDALRRALSSREPTREERVAALVERLEDKLLVEVRDATITLTLRWPDPEAAYDLVSAAVQGFLDERRATETGMVGDAIAILEAHAAGLQAQIEEAVSAIEERQRAVLLGLTPAGRAGEQARAVRAEELTKLGARLGARRREIQNLVDFRQRKVEELEAQLAREQTLYTPGHPALETTRETIAGLSAGSPHLARLERDAAALEAEIARRGGDPGAAGALVAALAGGTGTDLERGDPVLEYRRSRLRMLLGSYVSARERIDGARVELQTAEASFKYRYGIVTPPELPERTAKPTTALLLLAALAGGGLFAVFAAVATDLRSGLVLERWQLERTLGVPVVAELRE